MTVTDQLSTLYTPATATDAAFPDICERMGELATLVKNYFAPLVSGRKLPYSLSKGLSMSIFHSADQAKDSLERASEQWQKLDSTDGFAYARFRETLAEAFASLDQLFRFARLEGCASSIVGEEVDRDTADSLGIPATEKDVITGYEDGRAIWGTAQRFPLRSEEDTQRLIDSIAFDPRVVDAASVGAFEAFCTAHDIAPLVERITSPSHARR